MQTFELTLSSLSRLDWKEIYTLPWHLDIDEQPRVKHGTGYWNEKAKTMYEGEEYFCERAMAFLNFAKVPGGSSVLDIASGVGTLTIPLLKEGCKVTAVDVSDYSLEILEKNNIYGGGRLKTVNGYFRNVAPELKKHDYVLNYYSLGVVCLDEEGRPDLADTLIKMNDLAKKKVIITMPANEEDDIAGVHANSYYWILYGALLSLGIVPRLEFRKFPELGTLGYIYWKPVNLKKRRKIN